MKPLFFLILTFGLSVNIVVAQKQTRKKTTLRPTKIAAKQIDLSNSENQSGSIKDKPLKILYKPRAAYPSQENGLVCIQGTVSLRITFLETGEIGNISVISRLPYGATENAVEAAKQIKFEPAIKDGKPVNVTKTVQFPFSIY